MARWQFFINLANGVLSHASICSYSAHDEKELYGINLPEILTQCASQTVYIKEL